MKDLYLKTEILKSDLENKNFKELKKAKVKSITSESSSYTCQDSIKSYNYYVKLIKKIKKYISNNNCELIFNTLKDRFNNTICLITTFNPNELDISMTIDIRIITGNSRDTFMICSYYNLKDYGLLYIEDFQSGSVRCGYGSLMLKNLDNIIDSINVRLSTINSKSYDVKYNYIKKVFGKVIPRKSIISQKDLNNLYISYGFDVYRDSHNYNDISMSKLIN